MFAFNNGQDTIRNVDDGDFRNGEDNSLDLRSFEGLDSFADVRDHLSRSGGQIYFRDGTHTPKIEWISLGILRADDFIW